MDDDAFAQIHAVVRDFVRERVIPREQEIEQTDAIPDDLRVATADLGLFGYARYSRQILQASQDVSHILAAGRHDVGQRRRSHSHSKGRRAQSILNPASDPTPGRYTSRQRWSPAVGPRNPFEPCAV
jgi:acyl-CoA dehydrogenase